MSVKVTIRDGETIAETLERFRELLRRHGPPGTGVKRPKWHKNQLVYYLKPNERRRRDQLRDEFEQYAAECARRGLVCHIRRCKRRKVHFGDRAVVD